MVTAISTWYLLGQAQAQATLLRDLLAWLLATLGVIAFSELGIALVNWASTRLVAPNPLPRLDYSKGIPAAARSLVVVPSMIGSAEAVDALVEGLEVRFLANRDPHLHFALLTDFLDADAAVLPGDDALLAHARRQEEGLNARYAPGRDDLFFLFHRPRLWNARERTWMGLERKRGKLAALNALLRGGARDAFLAVVGDTAVLQGVRYVITLDTDTRLPRDAARELVGTLSHPLNRACHDPRGRRVARGYGILQPSVGNSMGEGRSTRYARMYGSEDGIDPYSRTVSDVYQDLFGEGSFIGKASTTSMLRVRVAGAFPGEPHPQPRLLEGCYARAGLVSDVRLFEDYPARYAADVKRRHRWIRGDWQLLPWVLPWVPRAGGGHARNPLSWLSRGKLLDNLRRSLVPVAALALLVLGWTLLPQPLAWTLALLGLWALPVLVPALWDLVARPADMTPEAHLVQSAKSTARQLQRAATTLACLPYEAGFSLDAILRSLWRVAVSRRHLLQWNPSSEVERQLGSGLGAELRGMWFAPAFSASVAVMLWRVNPAALWTAIPLLLAWAASPLLMAWLGRAPRQRRTDLSQAQLAFLGRLARRTWAFFEVHVRAEDHWRRRTHPEHPALVSRAAPRRPYRPVAAGQPAAYDFGYLQCRALLERTRNVCDTLEALPRHRGISTTGTTGHARAAAAALHLDGRQRNLAATC